LRKRNNAVVDNFEERILATKRTVKKTGGGNNMSFAALVVAGDKAGNVGYGYGKARDFSSAIRKGKKIARDSIITFNLAGTTITHDIEAKFNAAHIMLKPAPEGSGIIAGGVVREVLELAGVQNVSAKILGTNNKVSNVKCVIKALQNLRPELIKKEKKVETTSTEEKKKAKKESKPKASTKKVEKKKTTKKSKVTKEKKEKKDA
jgi:small subunit ribosomal protein S5